MNILIAFYTRTGTTQKAAEDMAELLTKHGNQIQLDELVDKKDRSGKIGYLAAAKDAMRKKETEIQEIKHDPKDFDMVILGTPVWAGTIAPALRTYLNRYGKYFSQVSFYCTHGGGGASKTFKTMGSILQKTPKATISLYEKDVKNEKHLDELETFVRALV